MSKAFFITFEGPDGGGKTTQLHLTAEWLRTQGVAVAETREPGGTFIAEELRRLVLSPEYNVTPRTELWLYLAARVDHVAASIAPALAEGTSVLCDRWNDSTLVYQGIVRGLPLDELQILSRAAAGGLEPDLTILLDANPSALSQRRNARGAAAGRIRTKTNSHPNHRILSAERIIFVKSFDRRHLHAPKILRA